ncbi:MAG TPA: hypothetical protein VJJ52_01785 [Candidatus Nanoarchaeia archaeon]|nr:hypothetical protein [Candidatus Nanoarchaeia archaeon]
MVNQSKINDPRFWAKWKASGAVEDKYESDRREAISHYRHQQEVIGNLTGSESKELERFEFRDGASTIDEQVRRYYLKLKSDSPNKAAQMMADVTPILDQGIHSLYDVQELCTRLHNYWSGFLIRYGGASYTMHTHRFQEHEGASFTLLTQFEKV